MKNSRQILLPTGALLIAFLLASTGCATRRYARVQAETQAGKVNQRVSQVETKTNEQMAALGNEISQTNERLSTVDQRLTASDQQLNSSIQKTNATAEEARRKADSNQTTITSLATATADALNFRVTDKADVLFGFGRSELTKDGKTELDAIAQKFQAHPRAIIQLVGFADKTGPQDANLMLSQKRAETVARYLVQQKVPLIAIRIVGLGEDSPPVGLESENQPSVPNPNQKDLDKLARRVAIRVYTPGDVSSATVAKAEP